MRLTMIAGIALLGVAAPALAAPPAPAPEAGQAEEKLICKKISDNPTDRLAPKRKVCMTKAQWKEARRQQRVEMPDQPAAPSRY